MPMRPTDRFRVGSVTKTFVATVVLQLVAEGKLTLDDTLERWLPGVVPNGDRVTVRQRLNHTSGIYNYTDDVAFLQTLRKDLLHAYTPADLVRIATSHTPAFEPGTSWAYSNTNYILLGLIVEAATGKPLADELRVRIFEPLALRATSFPSGPGLTGRYAHGYSTESGRLRDVSAASPTWTWAAGAVVSSADDLATFYGALLGGRLVPAGLRPELLRVVPENGYALGILRARVRCGSVWGQACLVPGAPGRVRARAARARTRLLEAMGEELERRGIEVNADPRVGGSIMRTARDTRFSKDKRPYKTHLDLWFWQGTRSRESPGYFFRLTSARLYLGAGMHGFERSLLERYREAVVDEARGRALEAAVDAVTSAGAELGGATYKRVPRGFDPDHQRADLLLHGGLYAGHELPVPPEVHTAAFPAWCAERLVPLRPLQDWVAELVAGA